MNNYDFQKPLKALFDKAIAAYSAGNHDCDTYFSAAEVAFLGSIGHTVREVFDFVEDSINSGEPDFETFLSLATLRRYYFLYHMKGQPGDKVVDTGDLPPKTDEVRGIVWLPRLIEKARAKLRGEMSDDLMYLCGGDRAFFKRHNLHPSDLLAFVIEHFDDDEAIIDFVTTHSEASQNT